MTMKCGHFNIWYRSHGHKMVTFKALTLMWMGKEQRAFTVRAEVPVPPTTHEVDRAWEDKPASNKEINGSPTSWILMNHSLFNHSNAIHIAWYDWWHRSVGAFQEFPAWWYKLNTLRPSQNGRHFPDDIFKRIFLNWNVILSIEISLKFVPKVKLTIFQHWFR